MKNSIAALIVGGSIWFTGAFGQTAEGADKQAAVNDIGGLGGNSVRQMKVEYAGLKGDPFIVKDFRPGVITMEDGQAFDDVLVNFDLVTNDLLVKKTKTAQPIVINKLNVKTTQIKVDFDTSVVVRRISLPKKANQFCWVLYAHPMGEVIVHQSKQVIRADYSGAYNQGKNYDEIVDEFDFYLLKPGASLEPFTFKKKSLAKLFPGKEDKVADYLRTQAPDFKDFKQAYKFFSYIMQ